MENFNLNFLTPTKEYVKPNLSEVDYDINLLPLLSKKILLPIFRAVHEENIDEIKKYVEGKYMETNIKRQTPLMFAVKLNKIEIAKLLLFEVGQIDSIGKTALDYAKEIKNEKMIELLEKYELED